MKKLSKRTKIIISLTAVLFCVVFICVYSYGTFEVAQLSSNSSLSLDLLMSKDNVNFDEYEIYPTEGMGNGIYYKHKDGCHRICVGTYPDSVFFSSRVIGVSIEDGCEDNVLGIGVGTSAREIYEIIDKYNYKLTKGSDDWIIAKKGRIRISIKLNAGGNAQDISVSVETTNIFGAQYKPS